MKSYSIFIKKNKENESVDDVILVKEGFNFYALIFNILWFLFKKMWICSIVFIIIIPSLIFEFHKIIFLYPLLFHILVLLMEVHKSTG